MKDFVLFSSEESSVQPVQQASPPDDMLVKLLKDVRTKNPNHGGAHKYSLKISYCAARLELFSFLFFVFLLLFLGFDSCQSGRACPQEEAQVVY